MSLTCAACRLPIKRGDDYILLERGVVAVSPKSGMDAPIPDVEDVLHPACAAEMLADPNGVLYDEMLEKFGTVCQNCLEEINEIRGEINTPDEVTLAPTYNAPVFIPPWAQGK
jgi:hypothetical protein